MDNWKVHSKRQVLQQGKFLTVEYHTIEFPDGQIIEDWSWLITPDFINVVIMDENEQFILFKQGKYGYEGESFAPTGGYVEPNEDPLDAAKREVLEEMGYVAETWHFLGKWVVDANRGAGNAYAFLATGAKKIQEADADDLEEQELLTLSRQDLESALFNGEVKVLPWQNIFLMALLHLDKHS